MTDAFTVAAAANAFHGQSTRQRGDLQKIARPAYGLKQALLILLFIVDDF
jgi:hypothetical protein